MKKQPGIRLTLTPADKVVEALGWIAVACIWLVVVFCYRALPESIPVHYNATGNVDRMGSKETILLLPAVATVLLAAFTLLARVPRLLIYPTRLTADNALKQYANAAKVLRYAKLAMALIFLYLTVKTVLW